ncbi:MAG: hypothetical protein Q8J74_13755 [Candidatus Didemnitutus sp.]|nr:hypothetical protein [Candidatus Didemnitutus sp.]
MTPLTPRATWALALGLGVVARLAGQELANKTPIDLPEFAVFADRALPPPERWFYSRIEGFEVLSNASERSTLRLLTEFQRFSHALSLVWPGMQADNTVPAALIVCGSERKFEEFLPDDLRPAERATTSLTFRKGEQGAIVLDHQTKILSLISAEGVAAASAAADPAGFEVDSTQQLYRAYISFLLAGREVAPPPWFAEGLSQLFTNLRITETEISVGRIENPNLAASGDRDFNAALAQRALMPMAELFAVTAESITAQSPLNSDWAKQCYAFVHWGLYGGYGRHQKGFVTFVARLGREPLTEVLFQECFKLTYTEMLFELRTHIEFTRTKFAGVRAGKGQKIPEPPAFTVREATEAEIGRLKGDTLMLAGNATAARAALLDAYRRGAREAGLLAAFGLSELVTGEPARARKLLEAAVASNAVRPRAYVELARLRLAEGLALPAGGNGRLSLEQTARVLEPLFTARAQTPALPEVYDLIAATWEACSVAPGAAHLEVIEEGVRKFPRTPALVYRAAELRAKGGFVSEAHGLVRLGLRVATDAAMRAKFEQLAASLPPLAAR